MKMIAVNEFFFDNVFYQHLSVITGVTGTRNKISKIWFIYWNKKCINISVETNSSDLKICDCLCDL